MLRIITKTLFTFSRFKVDEYSYEDYATMCGLLRQKYQLHNDQIITSGLVKLVDESNRIIGIYTASEARKKSKSLHLDMTLVSSNTVPVVCKAVDFRQRVSQQFFDSVVSKQLK